MSKVAIIKCNSYEDKNLAGKIEQGIELIGGLDKLFHKQEKILLKPNLLSAKKRQLLTPKY